jgi:DAK2 domain fusion protein YloV
MKVIDGALLKQMIISGANNLFNHYPEVDALNVFPVPDGDTGINMNLAIQSGAKEIQYRNDTSVHEIAKAFSKGLLMGARGNSGVILSQIFRGFAKSIDGKTEINADEMADAFVKGKEVAYKAVMQPVEGTILTVIREAADLLREKATPSMSIEKAFDIFLTEAKASLARTPELLPVLKEVGVVDSGGAGLVKIFEGFESALNGKVIEKQMATSTETAQKSGDESNPYNVEFVLRLPEDASKEGKKVFVEKRVQIVLESRGQVLAYFVEGKILKAHIHTSNSGSVLSYAQQFGEFIKVKVENTLEKETENVKFPSETNDKPEKTEEKIEWKDSAIISCCAGEGIEDLFKEYQVDYIVSGGQTMNPSTNDFVEAIEKVHAKNVYILPNNGNIVMAASQAATVYKGKEVNVKVIPSKTIPQGLAACMVFNPESSADENESEMNGALTQVKSGQVTYAIRDTEIDGVKVTKGHYIALFGKKIVTSDPNKLKATMLMLKEMVNEESSIIQVICGEDITTKEQEEISDLIAEEFPECDLDVRIGKQPVYSFIIGVE